MKFVVTLGDDGRKPVLTLSTETLAENSELSLLAAFDEIGITLELCDSDELVFMRATGG